MQDIKDRLKSKSIRVEDFQAINALLISRGYLSSGEGTRHRTLYHVAQRAQSELEDVLFVALGATLHHDQSTQHYRLLPFGDREVGLPDPGEDMETRRELKGSVVKDFVAALLTLRMLYDEKLSEAVGTGGRVSVRITEFATAMRVNFKVELPPSDFHRKSVFLKLKKHGVAEFDVDNLKDEDAVINIRPEITTLVFESAVGRALDVLKSAAAAEIESLEGDLADELDPEGPDENSEIAQ